MRLLDTHVGISSFVGTRAREGHVLVTSFVNNETADWKYKRDKMEAKVFRVAVVEASNKFLTLTLVSLLPEAPETKVYILSVVRSANVLSLFSLAKKADSYALSIRFENGNENIFPKWIPIISRKQIFYSVKLYSVLLIQLKFSFSKRRRDDLNIRMIIIIIKSKLSKVSFQYGIRLSIIWRSVTSL